MDTGHDSRAIGNIFVDKFQKNNCRLTIMPLVKLVYIAHGWTLGYTGKPLVRHQAEAWRHGPVIPEVYDAFRPQGVVITKKVTDKSSGIEYETTLSEDEETIVNEVYQVYANTPVFTLSKMTHREGTPWHQCKATPYGLIPNDIILQYYRKKVNERKATS